MKTLTKTLIATALVASSTIASAWDMPFFGNGNSMPFFGDSSNTSAGNGTGNMDFGFNMNGSGTGSSNVDGQNGVNTTDGQYASNGTGNGAFNFGFNMKANGSSKFDGKQYGYNNYGSRYYQQAPIAPVAK